MQSYEKMSLFRRRAYPRACRRTPRCRSKARMSLDMDGTLEFDFNIGLGLIKIKDVSANFNNPRPSLILNN